MDFLELAKDVLRKQIHAGLFDENELRSEIIEALRRAFIAGQEVMRERADRRIVKIRTDDYAVAHPASVMESYAGAGYHNALNECQEAIRTLPLQDLTNTSEGVK